MMGALWTAASGMKAQQTNIDVTSNNLANANTIGFKKVRAEFKDLMYRTAKEAGTPMASWIPSSTRRPCANSSTPGT